MGILNNTEMRMICSYRIALHLVVHVFILATHAHAQIKNIGTPYVTNFTKAEYGFHPKNQAIAQDKNGIMYFGNGDGLLQFDGAYWSLLRMPNRSAVISLYADAASNRIYVGAQGEFGYVDFDSVGSIRYKSLSKDLPKSAGGFGDIWKIFVVDDRLIAIASNMMMIHEPDNQWTIIKSQSVFFPAFQVRNDVFVHDEFHGLMKLVNHQLVPVKNVELLKGDKVRAIVAQGEHSAVIATSSGKLFNFDGNIFSRWTTECDQFLETNHIETAISLSDRNIAIATLHNGLLVMDDLGRPVQQLNSSKGLQSSSILAMSADNTGNLWLALENGIDFIELNSPFTYFNEQSNFSGAGYASEVHEGKLYLGTSHGVYYKDWTPYENPLNTGQSFKMLENSAGQTWSLNDSFGPLLLGHNNGGYIIDNQKAIPLTTKGAWMFLAWKKHPEILLEGGYSTLSVLQKSGKGNFYFDGFMENFRESFRIMEEDEDGSIWLSHPHKGIYKLVISDSLDRFSKVKFYNATSGLPSDFSNYIAKISGHTVFLTTKGVYRYNGKADRFEPDSALRKYFSENAVTKLIEDNNQNVWYVSEGKPGLLIKTQNGYKPSDELFGKLEGKLISNFEHINPIDDHNVLFGTEDGFVHYDPSKHNKSNIPFYVHIRNITNANTSRVLSGDSFRADSTGSIKKPFVLSYNDNALRFTFACTSYRDLRKNQFQFMLEGFDKSWSEWTSRTEKEYTNLPEGNYVFKIRARNFNHEISSNEARLKFRILPPWYRTGTAYFFYCIGSLVLMIGVIKVFQNQKEKQFRHEKLNAERKIIKLENEKLETEVSYKERELAAMALNITSKNEILDQIKTQLKGVSSSLTDDGKSSITPIIKLIDSNIRLDNDWKKFEFYFDQVHSDFLKSLRKNYPDLTSSQLKLCAYLKMNLSSKEIAMLMNVSVAGIEKSRYRLRKKFNLEHELMLSDFIQKI
jgi:ligand-binding sensor domain-containing protein